ncbi:MAG: hypothetical protein LBQ59_02565 [Candidatus Peribacteria bacterium]|nr:hypothetical protein [Candidatus Peribacteria bacterium]
MLHFFPPSMRGVGGSLVSLRIQNSFSKIFVISLAEFAIFLNSLFITRG